METSGAEQAKEEASTRKRLGGGKDWFLSLAKWQKALCAVAAAFLLLSLVLVFVEPSSGSSQSGTSNGDPGAGGAASLQSSGGGAASLVEGPGQPRVDPGKKSGSGTQSGDEAWSASFFRLGFSFFAGLSMGLALRTIMRLLLIGCGIALLFLFTLSYAELLTVNWQAIDGIFEAIVDRITAESGRFQSFITGSLPATGLAVLGLSTGLRRRR